MKTYLKKKWRAWRGTILLVTCVILPVRASIAAINFVPTGSMNTTILEGDVVFSNQLAYGLRIPLTERRLATWADPERGDIVICFEPNDGTRLVKRVIAIPGDTIAMKDNRVLINGKTLDYGPLDPKVIKDLDDRLRHHAIFASESHDDGEHAVMAIQGATSLHRSFPSKTMGPDEYFLMGDNRDNSRDSRIFGIMPRSKIVGQATHVALSFDKPGLFQPRWSRFFTPLD